MHPKREVRRLANSGGRFERARLDRGFPSCSSEEPANVERDLVRGARVRSFAVRIRISSFSPLFAKRKPGKCASNLKPSFSTWSAVAAANERRPSRAPLGHLPTQKMGLLRERGRNAVDTNRRREPFVLSVAEMSRECLAGMVKNLLAGRSVPREKAVARSIRPGRGVCGTSGDVC